MIRDSKPTKKSFDNFVSYAIKYLKKHYTKISAQSQKDILIKTVGQVNGIISYSSHDISLIKILLKNRKNYLKSLDDLKPLYFSENDEKIINKLNNNLNNITHTTIQSYVEVAYDKVMDVNRNKLFSEIMKQFDNSLDIRFPMLKREKRIKIEIGTFKRLLHSKEQAEILLANHKIQILNSQTKSILKKWLYAFNQKSNKGKKQYIHNLSLNAYHNFKQHQRNFRIAEYIIIPLIVFALPDIVSDVLTLVVGGFFKFIGMGVMMYAQHFMDIEAIPRLIMAIIADGIAYTINRKRDE